MKTNEWSITRDVTWLAMEEAEYGKGEAIEEAVGVLRDRADAGAYPGSGHEWIDNRKDRRGRRGSLMVAWLESARAPSTLTATSPRGGHR